MFFLQLSGINYVVINIIYILRSFNNNLNVEMSVIIVALTQVRGGGDFLIVFRVDR